MTTTTTPDGRLILHVEEPFGCIVRGNGGSRGDAAIRVGSWQVEFYSLQSACVAPQGIILRSSDSLAFEAKIATEDIPIRLLCDVLWHFRPACYRPSYGGTP